MITTPSLDAEFRRHVEPLSVPEMGTDAVAPLLYWLITATRPRTVLEVGMGYTTPFLARALEDAAAAAAAERARLDDPRAPDLQPLADPDWYAEPYEPRLVCIDRMTNPRSSAPRVQAALQELGLDRRVEIISSSMQGASAQVRERVGLLDLAWVDSWDTLAFLREYWPLVNPAGGILALHYLMTYPQGRAVLAYLNSLRRLEGGGLELTSFREPHKTHQNSLTLVRRTRDYVDPEDQRPFGTAEDPVGVLGG